MSRQITITVTDEAHILLTALAQEKHPTFTVEDYAKAAIAGHVYESLAFKRKFDAARAAQETIDAR